MSIKSVTPSNHLSLCCPLLLPASIVPRIRVFSNESCLCIRWPKYWSFSFNISPSNEHLGLISFRMDWLDLLAVQGTLKSLLQHHSSKASILGHLAFFTVQFSHLYMTTGKTIPLTRQIFVDKIMSLLFNMLSRLVLTFLPRSKCLNFMPAITICSDFGAQENKVWHCFPIYFPWSDGPDAMIFIFWMLENKAKVAVIKISYCLPSSVSVAYLISMGVLNAIHNSSSVHSYRRMQGRKDDLHSFKVSSGSETCLGHV